MKYKGIIRPNCPSCGKELAIYSTYGKGDAERSNRQLIVEHPEYAAYAHEWDGRTLVTRFRCSKCKVIYNSSQFPNSNFNEIKITPIQRKTK